MASSLLYGGNEKNPIIPPHYATNNLINPWSGTTKGLLIYKTTVQEPLRTEKSDETTERLETLNNTAEKSSKSGKIVRQKTIPSNKRHYDNGTNDHCERYHNECFLMTDKRFDKQLEGFTRQCNCVFKLTIPRKLSKSNYKIVKRDLQSINKTYSLKNDCNCPCQSTATVEYRLLLYAFFLMYVLL